MSCKFYPIFTLIIYKKKKSFLPFFLFLFFYFCFCFLVYCVLGAGRRATLHIIRACCLQQHEQFTAVLLLIGVSTHLTNENGLLIWCRSQQLHSLSVLIASLPPILRPRNFNFFNGLGKNPRFTHKQRIFLAMKILIARCKRATAQLSLNKITCSNSSSGSFEKRVVSVISRMLYITAVSLLLVVVITRFSVSHFNFLFFLFFLFIHKHSKT